MVLLDLKVALLYMVEFKSPHIKFGYKWIQTTGKV